MNDRKLKEKSICYFDQIADEGEILSEPELCYPVILQTIAEILSDEQYRSCRIADIGCGTGTMLAMIAETIGEKVHMTGADVSRKSLLQARKRCPKSIELVEADAQELPFDNESFDILVCMHSLHHYPRPETALAEMYRVLSPEGKLLLVENDYPAAQRRWINLKLFLQHYPCGDIRMYSRKRLMGLAEAAGFLPEQDSSLGDHSQFLLFGKGK